MAPSLPEEAVLEEEGLPPPSTSTTRKQQKLPFKLNLFPSLFSSFSSPPFIVAPSTTTAQGTIPVPLADNTEAALQKLNSSYPSSSSDTTTNNIYSKPVIVKTYCPTQPPQPRSQPRPSSSSASSTSNMPSRHRQSPSTTSSLLNIPFISSWTTSSNRTQKENEINLPPLEAFSFKSFLAASAAATENDGEGGGGGVQADLERIAEICARSRYSLSNQYEVHVAPHGDGSSSSLARRTPRMSLGNNGVVDEGLSGKRGRRKYKGVAYGTLETIMSNSSSSGGSQSSGEGKSRKGKKSMVDEGVEVGRTSFEGGSMESAGGNKGKKKEKVGRDKGGTRRRIIGGGGNSSSVSLVGEPALPRVSGNYLGVMTTGGTGTGMAAEVEKQQTWGTGWIPWRAAGGGGAEIAVVQEEGGGGPSSGLNAEGRLRQLLMRNNEGSGR
ncbi:hypothetical protein QBC38DRAFT_455608 [Podospora fimiseda]|uniref:Uncharacterized protein n=1 Tax=Podospora fimiseda TaxID=252190 RepID=A0AAN7BP10_9PEZI|nr:hypothetical protein QBC38DRAFT_455608 [Podospora fimiseda]